MEVITRKIIVDDQKNPAIKVYEGEKMFTQCYICEIKSGGSWLRVEIPFHALRKTGEALIKADEEFSPCGEEGE